MADINVMKKTSLRGLANEQFRELLGHLSGVREGSPDSVHRARIATRRLRELLPLARPGDRHRMDEVVDLLRRAGRVLGRVRELDVMHALLERQERRIPATAAVAATMRAELRIEREPARRRMIKALERLGIDRVADRMPAVNHRGDVAHLRHRVRTSATRLRETVQHAGGVYFPRRIHEVRIAAKKLRYAVEVAFYTGLWRSPRLLKDLRKAQEILGQMHDCQMLVERLESAAIRDEATTDQRVLLGALQGEIAEWHAEYLRRRDRIDAMVAACHRFASPRLARNRHVQIATASAVVAPALVWFAYRNANAGAAPRRPSAAA